MELFDLEYGVKSVATAGFVLNCQEISMLQAGLTILRSKENFEKIYLWGKIFGTKADYYIAYGLRDSDFEFPSKNFYVAMEGKGTEVAEGQPPVGEFIFQPLGRLTEEQADRIIALGTDKVFTGVPTTPLEPPADPDAGDAPPEDGAEQPPKPPPLTEADRLSQLVQEIDFDTAAVPKGSYALNEAHMVVPSSDFKGLGLTEAKSLGSFVHFRAPTSVACLRALARTDVQFYSNFLDPLKEDLPKGCWAVRQDPAASLVTLRSLAWPGYVAYHIPGSNKFGGLYFGYGQRNRDLPFIL
jgi:radial spoke head protein 9